MAEPAVRKRIADGIKAHLSKEGVKKTRAELQKVRPQILALEDLKFINKTLEEMTKRGRIKNVEQIELSDKNLKKARDFAKPHQDKYIEENKIEVGGPNDVENTPAGKFLKQNKPHIYNKILNGEMYLVRSFAVMAEIKKDIITELVQASAKQLEKILRRVDRGHGAGDGLAVTSVASARALGEVDKQKNEEGVDLEAFKTEFDNFLQNALETGDVTADVVEGIEKVTVNYQQVVSPSGEIKAEYVPIVEFQDKYTNSGVEKAREVRVRKLIADFLKKIDANEIVSLSGSSPLRDKVFAAAISNLIDIDIKGRKVKVTLDKSVDPRKVKLSTKGKAASKGKRERSKGKVAMKAATTATIPKGRRTRGTQNTVNIKTLLGIMNSQINDRVARNMGPPRLENRTGTFAGSVRITDVTQTRQGFPSIGYTYRKDPYQVFEASSGTRFSSAARDPRPLIDTSIREIAAQFAIGRLYTRRI